MSETRIVVEDPNQTCLHGNFFGQCRSYIDPVARIRCPGGRRRVLTAEEVVPVFRTSVIARTYAITADCGEADAYLIPADALAKSEQEGTE